MKKLLFGMVVGILGFNNQARAENYCGYIDLKTGNYAQSISSGECDDQNERYMLIDSIHYD